MNTPPPSTPPQPASSPTAGTPGPASASRPPAVKKKGREAVADQAQELWQLVVDYAKQETVDQFKALGRYVGFGLLGSVLMGTGLLFLALGLLRGMQELLDTNGSNDALSAVPYVITIVALVVVGGLIFKIGTMKQNRDRNRGYQ